MSATLIKELAALGVGEFSADQSHVRAADGLVYTALKDLQKPGRVNETQPGHYGAEACAGCDLYSPCGKGTKGFSCANALGRWKRGAVITCADGVTMTMFI